MNGSARKSLVLGALVGLLDGLAFAVSYHSSFDFLVPFLLPLALPCFAVVLRFPTGPNTPDWVPWTAGVLTMALVGAVVGLVIHWLRRRPQPSTTDATPRASGDSPHPETPPGGP